MSSDDDLDRAEAKLAQILYLIGNVVAAWAALDDPLIHLLARLAGCKPKAAGIMYYALDATRTRLTLIKGLAQHKLRKGKDRTELLKFLTRLDGLATTRNDIVHAVYQKIYDPKKDKWIIRKMVFRSVREKLYQKTVAQTGELKTHIRLLESARSWLFLSGWMVRLRPLRPDERARIIALKTKMANSSRGSA